MADAAAFEESPKTVAVVAVCYNQAHFLDDSLGSILAQTHPADEVIIIDDGSQDSTRTVAARYPQVRYIRQCNLGVSAARNTGLSAASSKFILFLDADDILASNALADAIASISATPQRAFVYGGHYEVASDRTKLAAYDPVVPSPGFDGLLTLGNYIAMHGTVLYNRAILQESGGFDSSLRGCEDYDVYFRLAKHHPIAAYDAIAAEYRRHNASATRNTLVMAATARRVILRHAGTRSERRAARKGIAFMTRFYGQNYWTQMLQDLQERRLSAIVRNLANLLVRPNLCPTFLQVGISRATAAYSRRRLKRPPRG